MLVRLDALRDDLEAEVVRQRHDRPHDRRVAAVGGHARDERAVDLERLRGHGLELPERRVADAEVVDRDPDAGRDDPLEAAPRPDAVAHEDVLGHLELERRRLDPVLGQDLEHLVGEARVGEVSLGDVHRDTEVEPRVVASRAAARAPPRGRSGSRRRVRPAGSIAARNWSGSTSPRVG